MLLDRGRGELALQLLDVGGDVHRLDLAQLGQPRPCFTPAEKHGGGAGISRPRVLVADVDGEEFGKAE
jgi:hypothetical protein